MGGAGFDRGDAVGHGAIGIIVCVDADYPIEALANFPDNFSQAAGQRASIGIAKAEDRRAGVARGFERLQGVGGVGRVTVEEMLRVVNHFFAVILEILHGFGNQLEVFLQTNAEGAADVQVPGLAEDRHHRRAGFHQRAHVAVFLNRILGEPRGTESGETGVIEFEIGRAREEFFVLGIRSGPAALDVIDAQLIQFLGNGQLVLHRKGDGLALRSVAEGSVESEDLHKSTKGCDVEARRHGVEALRAFAATHIKQNLVA